MVIPESNVWVQPVDLDPELGAMFDPLGNAVHTTLSFPLAGEDVVVTGAGPIGIRFPAEQWQETFATARSGQCGKVILDWS